LERSKVTSNQPVWNARENDSKKLSLMVSVLEPPGRLQITLNGAIEQRCINPIKQA
jgi:hypothetical protein